VLRLRGRVVDDRSPLRCRLWRRRDQFVLRVVVDETDLSTAVDLQEPAGLLTDGAEIDPAVGSFLPRLAPFPAGLIAAIEFQRRFSSLVPEGRRTVAVSIAGGRDDMRQRHHARGQFQHNPVIVKRRRQCQGVAVEAGDDRRFRRRRIL